MTLWAKELFSNNSVPLRRAAWYPKSQPTFSDTLAAVRDRLWISSAVFFPATEDADVAKVPPALLDRLADAACFPA